MRTGETDVKQQLLGLLALLASLASFWVDPQLGAPRDWDLLAIPAIPLLLWAAYRFTLRPSPSLSYAYLILPTIVITLVGIVPNLYEKTHADIALSRLDGQLWLAPQYQMDYAKANRCLSWGTTLIERLKRDDLAAKYFHRRLEAEPESPSAWFNLGQIHQTRGSVDSALLCFDKAVQFNPEDPHYLLKLTGALHKKGRFAEALPVITKCARVDATNPTVQTNFGITLYRLGREAEALDHFREAFALSRGGAEEAANLGSAYFGLRQDDSAMIYLARAIEAGSREPRVHESLILAQLATGRIEAAQATLARFRSFNPQSGDLDYYRRQLADPERQRK
jgi:Flp pilus assembly protein TadD